MVENNEIVEALARDRVVEQIVERVCKRPAAELCDLVSIVHEALLCLPPDKLRSLAEGGLNYYIVGMVQRQFFSTHNTFYRECIEFAARTAAKLSDNIADESTL